MRHFNRRFFVMGGGATLALPLMESVVGSKAFGQMAKERFTFILRSGNGIVQNGDGGGGERFWPRNTVLTEADLRDNNADRATSELAAFGPKLMMIRNVKIPVEGTKCAHSESIVQLLTAADHVAGSGNDAKSNGRSVDWLLAEKLNATGVAPLAFMAGPTDAFIQANMSWSGPGTRVSAEHNPLSTYMRLVGMSAAPLAAQQLIATRRKSVNDLVREQLSEFKKRNDLSTLDKQRLDQHVSSVRDMEVRMTCDLEPAKVMAVKATTNPEGNDVRPEVAKRFMELTAWAFSCGLNHVGTLQMGDGNDGTQYQLPGVNGGNRMPSFHWISHRQQGDGGTGAPIDNAFEMHHQIDRFHLRMYRYVLEQLNSYASPTGGKLLDDCAAVWCNDLGSGAHTTNDLPFIIAGNAGGTLRSGRVVDLKNGTVNLVLNTLINAMGIKGASGGLYDDFGSAGLTKGLVPGALA
jgi:hypothetical protein